MTFAEFERSLKGATPPRGLAPALTALWWAHKDDWDQAHTIVMNQESREAAWVHAYLHRVEGDAANAAYWYRQATQPVASGALAAEWQGRSRRCCSTRAEPLQPGRGGCYLLRQARCRASPWTHPQGHRS